MKKIIRLLGVTLAVVVLTSCDPNGGEIDTTPEVSTQNITGNYTYYAVIADKPVDTDKDGEAHTSLMFEKGKECVWDNIWDFTATAVTLYDKGEKCDSNDPEVILSANYEYNKSTNIITIKDSKTGESIDVLKDVAIKYDDYSKQYFLSFFIFDTNLDMNVKYVLARY
jgi:hypothetical protein